MREWVERFAYALCAVATVIGAAELAYGVDQLAGVVGLAVLAGIVLLLVLAGVVIVGRESEERRGGVLQLDTPEARAAIELSERRRGDEWHWPPVPVIIDPDVPQGTVELRPSALRCCNPARGVHYHAAGDRCQCGEQPNVFSVSTRLGGDEAA